MATTEQLTDRLGALREVSYKNFAAGDKVLLLLNGVKITLDNTRDEFSRTVTDRERTIGERNERIAAYDREMAVADGIRRQREIEYQRQANALDSMALEFAATSQQLQTISSMFEMTTEQLQQITEAKAKSDAAYLEAVRAKDALLAEEVKAKLQALDAVAKANSELGNTIALLNEEKAARESAAQIHADDNAKVLVMIEELFQAEGSEDKDLRDASAAYDGGYAS